MPETIQAHCACGRVVFEAKGGPLEAIACYCDDCQAVGKQIDALPDGHSGLGADGGTVSMLFRKDLVRCVRGAELLKDHKLRSASPATRQLASCCNSNMTTRFENWLPITALRTHSVNVQSFKPAVCIHTRFAPDATKLVHAAPRHPSLPPRLKLKVAGAAVALALPWLQGDGRLTLL
ncbi:MAG TPA: hypothetical protein VK524_19715 [Polyangiaceae bacterium]|nr:hypothetical protein [Polyangiaceae bacterium]